MGDGKGGAGMNSEFLGALEQIAEEKGIEKEVLLETIEAALISAYRQLGSSQNVAVTIDRERRDQGL